MPQLAIPRPTTMRDIVLTIDGSDAERQVSEVTLTPSSSQLTWQGCSPDATFVDQTSQTWAMTMTVAQDWDDPDSLANWLLDNAGREDVAAQLRPRRGGPGFGIVISSIATGTIGGAQGAPATQSVTMGLTGSPVRVPAA